MEKKLIFGIGTGRSGSFSLFLLFKLQKSSNISHQRLPILSWELNKESIDKKIKKLLKRKKRYNGDIATYYLNYVDYILEKHSHTKFIVLKRDREKVVESYYEITYNTNPWMNHDGKVWKKSCWDKSHPKYDVSSKKEAIRKFHDEYYRIVDSLVKKYPENIKVYETSELLNNKDKIKEMLEFSGFFKKDMRLISNIRFNKRYVHFPFIKKILVNYRKYIYEKRRKKIEKKNVNKK